MTIVFDVVLFVLAVPLCGACLYLMALTLLSAPLRSPPRSKRLWRFDIVVPAHNEAQLIERTIASLHAIDWPRDRFRICVVADNCTDRTTALARDAGATVLERDDPMRAGKGYALDYAFSLRMCDAWAQAFVVVDADSEVSPNLLEAFAARLERGAQAVQAHYGVLNPWASWRTRLLTIAIACFHTLRSRARERLGLSCGIRGNGWCVVRELLRRVPHKCFSLAEDLEYGIALGLSGVRVEYAGEAHVEADMVATRENVARRQRQRWEDGRLMLAGRKVMPLLHAAIRRRSLVCLDLAVDLLVLPLAYVVLAAIALLVLAATAAAWHPGYGPRLAVALACCGALLFYVLRGWQLSGMGLAALADFARVPGFLAWKVVAMLRPRDKGWISTERDSSSGTRAGRRSAPSHDSASPRQT
jgi:cellulose synthase/poly-beta-1,6-N-acetylglucosamine synthase-like glycosyltransferase